MNWLNEDAKTAYQMLIANGSTERLDGYCERHHIIPRSMGGTDDAENLVYVTASTHLYLHYWLWVGTGDSRMGNAYFQMANSRWSKYDATPLVTEAMIQAYENAKIAGAKAASERETGKTLSAETRAKMSAAHAGKTHSAETRVKMSEARAGKTVSAETRAKISEAHAGEKSHMFGKTGEKSHMFGKTGSLSPRAKKVLIKLDCGFTFSYGSAREAARCLGVNQATVSHRCTKGNKGFSYA